MAARGCVALQLLKGSGQSVGKPFSGELIDISEGGISARVKSRGYGMARLILGRDISSMLHPEDHEKRVLMAGRVTSVNALSSESISLHIAFEKKLDAAFLEGLISL